MLVLSRKAGECVKIGSDVTLEVRKISGNRVTIAFRAPKDVRILRGELHQATQEFEASCPVEKREQVAQVESKQAQPNPEQWATLELTVDATASI